MDQKLIVNLVAALVPIVVGFIWYNPMVFGNILIKANGKENREKPSPGKLVFSLLVTYLASFFIASRVLGSIVIHQHGFHGMLANQPDLNVPGTDLYNTVHGLLDKYGSNFRTFKHGALHGSLTGLFLVFPILGIIAVHEPKPFIWVAIHSAFWIACLAIMGGIICQYMPIGF